jgi:putative endonuclease
MWYVYILRCSDNSLYTGITTNLSLRIKRHNSSKGAKYLRSKIPATLVFSEKHSDKSAALKREFELKSLTKAQKEKLISSQ